MAYLDSRNLQSELEDLEAQHGAYLESAGLPMGEAPLDEEELARMEELITARAEVSEWNYGATLIPEDEFLSYAQELAEDIGAVARDADWPICHIDWEAAADCLKEDYAEVTLSGVTYLVRA